MEKNRRSGRERPGERDVGMEGMETLCQTDCCLECGRKEECGGCAKTEGHPFGGTCVAAEWIKRGGFGEFSQRKRELIEEINALGIENLRIEDLHLLNGSYVNLEYPLPGGQRARFLEDRNVYWGKSDRGPGQRPVFRRGGGRGLDSGLSVRMPGSGSGGDPLPEKGSPWKRRRLTERTFVVQGHPF